MSVKTQLGLQGSIIGLLIFGIIVGGIFIQETKNIAQDAKITAAKNVKIAQDFDKRVTTFIDNWNKRITVSNKFNNQTLAGLINESKTSQKIFDKQISNENNILSNLTRHRIVANTTRDITIDILNDTHKLIQQLNTTQQKSVANLTAQHNDILEILKHKTNSTND